MSKQGSSSILLVLLIATLVATAVVVANVQKTQTINSKAFSNQKLATQTTVPCDGDGISGPRVQIIYLRASDIPDHYQTDWIESYKSWVKQANDLVINSAKKTGGYRSIRFVHDVNCSPIVENVIVDPLDDDPDINGKNRYKLAEVLAAKGYNRQDRKYLIFADDTINVCGDNTEQNLDDRPGQDNLNNFGPDYSFLHHKCWLDTNPKPFTNQAPLYIAHELMHSFGAVQFSAPHSDQAFHCVDDYDLVCTRAVEDTSNLSCPNSSQWFELDCGNDDYFHTNPQPGNYLYNHWNTANSQFLIKSTSTTPPPPPPPPPPTYIQGYIFKDANNDGTKNKENNEPSTKNISIALFENQNESSIFIKRLNSIGNTGQYNFRFTVSKSGQFQLNRPKLPESLSFENCSSVKRPKNVPSVNHYFYCQGQVPGKTKYKLYIKKWNPSVAKGFTDVTPWFQVNLSQTTKIDIPLVKISQTSKEVAFED